jgi:hypothetical protein
VKTEQFLARLGTFDDLTVPDMGISEFNDREWPAVAAIPIERIDAAARASAEAMEALLPAGSMHPDAGPISKSVARLTEVVAKAETVRAAERIWSGLTHDEQGRCAERAAHEFETLPTALAAKQWIGIQALANARQTLLTMGDGDIAITFARVGSPALAWLTACRMVADVYSAPGQGAKSLGLRRRWPFG